MNQFSTPPTWSTKEVGKVFYGQKSLKGRESGVGVCGVNYQLIAGMLQKLPNGQRLVAVYWNQLRTMTSKTVLVHKLIITLNETYL